MRKKLETALDLAIAFVFLLTFCTAYHEYVHAVVTGALGGSAYVHFSFIGGYAVPSGVSGTGLIAVAFSGGLFCALVLWYIQHWWLNEPTDWNCRLVCRYFMLGQLFYGIAEGTYFMGLHTNLWLGGQVSQVIAVMALAAWYLLGKG